MVGRKFAHYEITGHLGSGGMGDVYQATDLKLRRSVAIKFLPETLLHDSVGVARFQREARVLAALNHPNIAVLHGMEESDGRLFLVMELVEGETLADRVARGAVPLKEALQIAKQIAEALEAAHEKGIVHRDLKPANVKITPGGIVKVLDFGLASIRQPAGADTSSLPTQMTISQPGAIIGTPVYMAPEQATGEEAGRGADVWAFGCVLYELLAGRRVFRGETTAEVLAGVLKAEPDWSCLPAETPERILRVLRRCLQKDLRSRLHDIADARIELEDVQSDTALVSGSEEGRRPRWRERVAWAVGILSLVVTALVLYRLPAALPETYVDIVTPPEADAGSFALSPDGRTIVYAALTEGGTRLWLRSLGSATARPLSGTEGAALPFWSPNGHAVAFLAEGKLNRIDIDTGEVQALAAATLSPSGGTWNEAGTILFSPSIRGEILRLTPGGPATRLVPDGAAPKFFPDGQHFLFSVVGKGEDNGVYVGSLDGTVRRRLFVDPDFGLVALPGPLGQVLYVRSGMLYTDGFDLNGHVLSGNPSVVGERVPVSADGLSAAVSVSASGALAYRTTPSDGSGRRLATFDRQGHEISATTQLGGFTPTMSRDGRLVAVSRTVASSGNNVWLLETARGRFVPFTSGGANQTPLFSPDGRHIVFSSARSGTVDLFIKSLDGVSDEPLLVTANNKVATDWSLDGEFLLYRDNDNQTRFDIWALPMQGPAASGMPFPVLKTAAAERDAQFSPDRKWIAYESDVSGQSEIYVCSFPRPGRQIPVSANGGAQARWSRNGKTLFYIALDSWLMAVPVLSATEGASVEFGQAERLFPTRVGGVVQTAHKQQYVVADDGQSFLMSVVAEDAVSPITLILNWKPPRK